MDKRIKTLLRILKNFNLCGEFYQMVSHSDNLLKLDKNYVDEYDNFIYNAINILKMYKSRTSEEYNLISSIDKAWNTLLDKTHLPHYEDYYFITENDDVYINWVKSLEEQKYLDILTK